MYKIFPPNTAFQTPRCRFAGMKNIGVFFSQYPPIRATAFPYGKAGSLFLYIQKTGLPQQEAGSCFIPKES